MTTANDVAALIERERAVYDSMTPEQRALVNEARTYATNYAASFVDRTRELDEMRRRLRGFAATWHAASGHDLGLDDCTWSTCLDLLTGRIATGEALHERAAEVGAR